MKNVSMLAMCHLGACWISAVAWTTHGGASAFALHLLLELILNIFVTDDKPDASPHHFALTQAQAETK